MPRRTALVALLAFTFLLTGCTQNVSPAYPSAAPSIVAHRGGDEVAGESSLEAILTAAQDGFPVEIDITRLGDGTWAIAHATTPAAASELAGMDATQWAAGCVKAPDGTCGKPTTWQEVLAEAPSNAVLVPEIKDRSVPVKELAETIRAAHAEHRVIVQSVNFDEAKALAAHGIRTLFLVRKTDPWRVNDAAAAGIEILGVNEGVNRKVVSAAKAKGLSVWAWTINSPNQVRAWLDAGAEAVLTDHPREIRSALSN